MNFPFVAFAAIQMQHIILFRDNNICYGTMPRTGFRFLRIATMDGCFARVPGEVLMTHPVFLFLRDSSLANTVHARHIVINAPRIIPLTNLPATVLPDGTYITHIPWSRAIAHVTNRCLLIYYENTPVEYVHENRTMLLPAPKQLHHHLYYITLRVT